MLSDYSLLLKKLRNHGRTVGHRYAVTSSGSANWTGSLIEEVLLPLFSKPVLLAQTSAFGLQAIHAKTLLGTEVDLVLCDLSTVNANALGAAVGAIRAGGLLFCWRSATQTSEQESNFSQFLLSTFRTASCIELQEAQALPNIEVLQGKPSNKQLFTPNGSVEQQVLIEKVHKVAMGRARRPLVVKADRGRGKSAGLGLAVRSLFNTVKDRSLTVLITAPRKTAVAPIFEHCPPGAWGRHKMLFIAPDELLRSKPEGSLLLVDEAAAIPVNVLEQLSLNYSRVVFSSTVHGYEGSGRGFDLRFKKRLDNIRPQWQEHLLHAPIRWSKGDPLEAVIAEGLLLNASIPQFGEQTLSVDDKVVDTFKRLDSADILVSEENRQLLAQAFALLVNAHYQTEPSDLQTLLNETSQSLLLAMRNGEVVAACMLVVEGELQGDIAEEVYRSRRRLKGHLLPQSLACHYGYPELLANRFCRVVRIAVHPQLQRRGLGLKILDKVSEYSDADFVGTSFAYEESVLQFWQNAGYQLLRVGSKRDTCSGSHSVLMIKQLNNEHATIQSMREQLAVAYPVALKEVYSECALAETSAILACLARQSKHSLSQATLNAVLRYIGAELAYESAYAALYEFSCAYTSMAFATDVSINHESGGLDTELHAYVVIAKLLQGKQWAEVACLCGLSGRKMVEQRLRQALAEILDIAESKRLINRNQQQNR